MLAITRHPTGQDLSCLVCRTTANIDIDHVVNRGSGGSKQRDVPENKVPLCRECHTAKTNGVLETNVYTGAGEEHVYYQWRRNVDGAPWQNVHVEVSKRYKCLVLSDGAEGESGRQEPLGSAEVPEPFEARSGPSAPSPSVRQEESDGLDSHDVSSGGDASSGQVGGPADASASNKSSPAGGDDSVDDSQHHSVPHSSLLTHEQRAAIAAGIKEMEQGRQWLAGDTANEWEEELGERFWNEWANEFGYTYPSLRNNQRVCRKIPSALRSSSLRFSHHVVVADLNLEDIDEWLGTCEIEQWSVAEFRIKVKGERPRVKRYSPGEIHDLADEYPFEPVRDEIRDFADWLGQRDNDGLD